MIFFITRIIRVSAGLEDLSSVNSDFVGNYLLKVAEKHFLSLGCDAVVGPARFNTNGEILAFDKVLKSYHSLWNLITSHIIVIFLVIKDMILKINGSVLMLHGVIVILQLKGSIGFFQGRKAIIMIRKSFDVFHVYDDFFEPGKDVVVRTLAKKTL